MKTTLPSSKNWWVWRALPKRKGCPSGLHVGAGLLYIIFSQKAVATVKHHFALLLDIKWHTGRLFISMGGELCWQTQTLCPAAQAGCWVPPKEGVLSCALKALLTRGLQCISGWRVYRPHQAGIRGGKLASLNRPQAQLSHPLTGNELSRENNGMEIG